MPDNYYIKELLQKHEKGDCTREEEKTLSRWYRQFPEYTELTFSSQEEKQALKQQIKREVFATIERESRRNKKTGNIKPVRYFQRVAAAAVLALALGAAYWSYFTPQGKISLFATAITVPQGGEIQLITLPDSSRVWLRPGSTFRYPKKFAAGTRLVELTDGVAFFSVTPDTKQPFSVKTADGIKVYVLGTSFNVESLREVDDIDITVATGRVEVKSGIRSLGVLNPDQQLVYFKRSGAGQVKTVDASTIAGWKEGDIHLMDAGIDEITRTLSDIYGVSFQYDASSMKKHRINIRFSTAFPLEQVMEVLENISGITYEKREQDFILKTSK